MFVKSLMPVVFVLSAFSTLHAGDQIAVGGILPLAGKYEIFGNKIMQAMGLAVDDYNTTPEGKMRPARLLVKNSRGRPDGAVKAVAELDKEGVDIIIGPLLSSTADAAAAKAQELKIPIITLSQKEGITETGEWIYRNCVTLDAQVGALADHIKKEGIARIAVLHPDNKYGMESLAAILSALHGSNSEVVAFQSYKENKTDFGPEIKALAGEDFLKGMKAYTQERERIFKEAEKAGKKIDDKALNNENRPRPPFDAVFIPDFHDRVGLILPQLAYYDITGVSLLGLGGWNSQNLLSLAGGFAEGAVFVDAFFSGSRIPRVSEFVDRYRQAFGEDPVLLDALAYDSVMMALASAQGRSSRTEIKGSLDEMKDYNGVMGKIWFRQRDAQHPFFLLTVRNGAIEELGDR